jgi:hypothetical protein
MDFSMKRSRFTRAMEIEPQVHAFKYMKPTYAGRGGCAEIIGNPLECYF